MASIPSPIRKWIQRWVTGVGSDEVASQAPVQSVDGETGEVTISVPVDQVNGKTGDVTLTASDVNALADTYTAPVQSVNGNTGSVTISVPVDDVNGQTGSVTLSAADVNALADTYSAPVQSVNSQTGDVTISTGSAIGGSVTNYSDLPLNLSERQFYYVSSEQDVAVQTNAGLDTWKSISDFTTVASAPPDSGVSRFTFDDSDTDSGTAIDIWNGYNASISGAITGDSGYYNQSYNFDGNYDFVELDDTFYNNFFGNTQPATLTCWVNMDGTGSYNIISYDNAAFSLNHEIINSNGFEMRAYDRGGNDTVVSSGISTTNSWTFLAGTYDTNGIEIYVDGNFEGSESGEFVRQDDYGPYIGIRQGNNGDFDGGIDDVRIYDKALSSTEISNLYNNGAI